MSKFEKLVERIKTRPPEADFDDVCKLLEGYGWTMRATGATSHVVFTKEGESRITVPTKSGRKVKRVYLDDICDRLGL